MVDTDHSGAIDVEELLTAIEESGYKNKISIHKILRVINNANLSLIFQESGSYFINKNMSYCS